jgi:hypothetical protein
LILISDLRDPVISVGAVSDRKLILSASPSQAAENDPPPHL